MKKVNNVIFFDVASKTGWAARISPKTDINDKIAVVKVGVDYISSGVHEVKAVRGESPAMRFRRFSLWAEKMFGVYKPDLIGYEQIHFRGGYATELLVGFTTRLAELAAVHDIECTTIHSSTLKKFATGSGKAKKPEVIAAMRKRYPMIEIIDDNHADALAGLSKLIEDYVVLS